jgi:predicted RNA binding protein YcfA (HicA-like mRNA interferase family)
VPRKVRELEADLRREGFTRQSGKGSHRRWLHPLYPGHVVMSGKTGDDAKPYTRNEKSAMLWSWFVMQRGDNHERYR